MSQIPYVTKFTCLFININQLDALNFIISLFQASTCFEHMCTKHVEAWNKLIIKFSASSWLILINKYIEIHGQQNIKISLLACKILQLYVTTSPCAECFTDVQKCCATAVPLWQDIQFCTQLLTELLTWEWHKART